MIHRREFEDKLTKELLKIVHYHLKTSIRLCMKQNTGKRSKNFTYLFPVYKRPFLSILFFSRVSDVAKEWNSLNNQGPVVWMQVSANPGLNFNPGSLIFLSKALFQVIFSFRFRVSNRQIVGKEN